MSSVSIYFFAFCFGVTSAALIPTEMFVKAGDRVILPCSTPVSGIVQCDWTMRSDQLPILIAADGSNPAPPSDPRTYLDSNLREGHCNFIISTVQLSDAALYTCSLKSSQKQTGYVAITRIKLIVQGQERAYGTPVVEEDIKKEEADQQESIPGVIAKAFGKAAAEEAGKQTIEKIVEKISNAAVSAISSFFMLLVLGCVSKILH